MRTWLILLVGCGTVSGGEDGGVDTGGEDCFNGADDNGNGAMDCSDPGCGAVAVCAAEGALEAGVLVGMDEACPAGFEGGETVLHRDVLDTGCEGCTCTPGTTQCLAELWLYTSAQDCNADTTLSQGAYYGVITPDCTAEPVSFSYAGSRASVDVAAQTCTTAGTALRPAVAWGVSRKFCKASQRGVGCGAAAACVPKAAAPADQCARATGPAECAGYQVEQPWYTGADDTRTCGPCECSASGGSCADVRVQMGSDWSCSDESATMGEDERTCLSTYSPPARTIGISQPPTACEATSAVAAGMVTPTGENTVCCVPMGS